MRAQLLALLLLAGCATATSGAALREPVAAALPPDQAPLTEGDVTTATVNGLRIIVKRTPGAEFAAGQLVLLGGVRNWTAQNAGIEELAVAVATRGGTTHLDKGAFARRLAALGAWVSGGSGVDAATFSCAALLPQWDETFALLVDAFLHPALPASELELARTRALSALRHEQESPSGRLGLLLRHHVWAGHPYGNTAEGTLESVAAVKAEELEGHLAKLRETSRMIWVVAGDVDPQHVVDQAKAAFGALPRGNYQHTPLPPVHFTSPKVFTEERELPTNYIAGDYLAPGWKDADLAAGLVATSLLDDRLFDEVRTKRNLSYAPSAGLTSSSEVPLGSIGVTAVDANATFKVMLDEVRRLQREKVSAKELLGTKSTFLTGLLMGDETVGGQVNVLVRATIYGGDWHLSKTLPERIRAVTPDEVQRFANTWMHNIQTGVVGDPKKVDPALFQSL